MANKSVWIACLLLFSSYCHGRFLHGIKIIQDPTSPIYTSTTTGGFLLNNVGVQVADKTEIIANKQKANGQEKTTFVKAEGSAVAVGILPTTTVTITTTTTQPGAGGLQTNVSASSTALFNKPLYSAAQGSIEQKQTASAVMKDPMNKKGPGIKVTAEAAAAVAAKEEEMKAPSNVRLSATTNSNVIPSTRAASVKQVTTVHHDGEGGGNVGDNAANVHQSMATFGGITAERVNNGEVLLKKNVTSSNSNGGNPRRL